MIPGANVPRPTAILQFRGNRRNLIYTGMRLLCFSGSASYAMLILWRTNCIAMVLRLFF